MSLGLGLFDAWLALGRIGPSAVVGFGGYACVPTMVAARLRRLPAMLHEQNAVLGRANRMVAGGVERIATSFDHTRFIADGDGRARLVGNPVRESVRQAARSALSRAGRGPRHRHRGVRRQPGRRLVQPGRARGDPVAAAGVALPHPPGPAVPPGGFRQGAPALRARRRRRRAGAVLRRPAAAPGGGASGDRPRRRLDRGRARDHRPAVDPGALSLRRRRPPDRQCPRLRGGGRLHRDAARRVHRRGPGRPSRRRCSASRSGSPPWLPPPTPRAGPMPPHASPTWSAR